MFNRKTFGNIGEAETIAFLEAQGYRIVDSNVRPQGGPRRGEIDVIAWDGEYLVFIEVKTRRQFGSVPTQPSEAVDLRKRRQLITLANSYLSRYNFDNVPGRFDVVEVVHTPGRLSFNLIKNAFTGDDV